LWICSCGPSKLDFATVRKIQIQIFCSCPHSLVVRSFARHVEGPVRFPDGGVLLLGVLEAKCRNFFSPHFAIYCESVDTPSQSNISLKVDNLLKRMVIADMQLGIIRSRELLKKNCNCRYADIQSQRQRHTVVLSSCGCARALCGLK
jgi:hypothetical protein